MPHGWRAFLPNREVPPEIEITEDMLRLQAFKVVQKEQGSASLSPGDHAALRAITEFGAKPYTEDEEKSLSEIVKAFNDRHGTEFTEADMLRFEQVNREILTGDMAEMRNNPPDVVFTAFSQAFFQGAIRQFKRERHEEHHSERSRRAKSGDQPGFEGSAGKRVIERL
jgi:type I restriction enzyme, R subunit